MVEALGDSGPGHSSCRPFDAVQAPRYGRELMREIGVGLLGLGNVGSGVVKLLQDNSEAIEARLGARVVVRKIAVQKAEKRRLVEVDKKMITTSVESVIDDPSVEVVIELIGGENPARSYVARAI